MIENLAKFVENHITNFDGYIWDARYGNYNIGQVCSVKHLGNKLYEDFNSYSTEPETLDSFELIISKTELSKALEEAIIQEQAANGGTLPPLPSPQYTIQEVLNPNNTNWALKNDSDRPDWFSVRVRRPPLVKTFDYRFRLVVQGI